MVENNRQISHSSAFAAAWNKYGLNHFLAFSSLEHAILDRQVRMRTEERSEVTTQDAFGAILADAGLEKPDCEELTKLFFPEKKIKR